MTAPGECPMTTRQLVLKCLDFVQVFSNRKFYKFQCDISYRIIESVLLNDGMIITGLVSRQAGKTETVSKTVIGLAVLLPKLASMFPADKRLSNFQNGFSVLIFGPIEDKALLPFDRARELVNSEHGANILAKLKITTGSNRKGTLTFSNGSVVTAKSASANTNNEGFTGNLIVLEETQDISRSKIDKEIRPILANTRGSMVAIGTANEVGASFKEMILANQETEARTGVKNHFEANWRIVVTHKNAQYAKEEAEYKSGKSKKAPFEGHLNYEKHVRDEIARYGGEDVPEFRMNFMLMWREGGAGAIDRPAWLRSALVAKELGQRVYPGAQVAAIDVGKVNDSTFVTVGDLDWSNPIVDHFAQGSDTEPATLYRKCVTDMASYKGDFEDRNGKEGQYQKIVKFLTGPGKSVSVLCIDSTSVGDPVFERLRVLLGDTMNVVPIKFTHIEKNNLYKHYTQEIVAGRVLYNAGPITQQMSVFREFEDQHAELLKVTNEEKGTVSYEAPQGHHDDAPDSGALLCRAATLVKTLTMPYIECQPLPRGLFGGPPSETRTRGRRIVASDSPFSRRKRLDHGKHEYGAQPQRHERAHPLAA